VDSITEAAARIRSDDLSTRIPTGGQTDEIARLARTLNRMLDRVAESVGQLRSLTDTVAHELKSPVTSIHGRLEVALSSHEPARLREAAEFSIEDLDRLANFITTTLDVAEADAGGLRIRSEVADFSGLVSKLLSLYEPAFTERQLALVAHLADHDLVRIDVSLVTRALANLLDNELNHTRPGTTVTVTTAVAPSGVRLRIEDDGPGFPPGVATRLFRRFAKGGPSGGHGLGLAFVRAIVTAHGGHVTGGNRPEGGVYVEITLAAAQDASTA
jgi:signal transduction histidine kinase